ncbi:histidine phosphatase superfamily [Mycena albidolilacea]|uniref:Histidine phosphatase superfamily n=1 Tax=Mycena albidolilacea TaxID=1033008 RepID=A0AAD7EX29_9AGAR|nr:histidine phosphatase superfamily [Mycena albidolilacea]
MSAVATDSALRVGFNGKKIHLLRHGQAIHNVQRGYPFRDPPLTDQGLAEARAVSLDFQPDLVICSPMNRTINTALAVLPDLLSQSAVEIWPDMREAHDAICNKGVSRAELSAAFPDLDFSRCNEEWDYEDHSHDAATRRAERVRTVLAERSEQNILLVGHRGFIDYLVAGPQFANCELRSYRFGPDNTLVKIS